VYAKRVGRVCRPGARACYFCGVTATERLLAERRTQILDIAAKYGAYNIRVFGSFARGDADESSDIDFLVDLQPGRSLLDLGGLLTELADLLERDVDVLTARGLKERIRERVLAEAVAL
jgi:uncharacterized protein